MKRNNLIPQKSVAVMLPASRILTILGSDWFVEFKAVRTSGRVLWCNFELARTLGFDVPPSNRMTPKFHEQLVDTLSYRAVTENHQANGRPTLRLFADKYGGEGIGKGLGSARSGFLPFGNLFIKGVGLTPLFTNDDPNDLRHSHGGLQLNHCLGEALFGEVNHHLFSRGSTRIIAIIDQGEFVAYRNKRKVTIALNVRSGKQLRPGHLLAKQVPRRSLLEAFIRITKETKQLVMRNQALAGKTPDIKATMLRIIDDHACTAAEHFRWRMIHGAITSSNMEMSGAALDLTTNTAQPRTAPVYFREDHVSYYGHEHLDYAKQLRESYQTLVKSIALQQRRRLNATPFNFIRAMERAYARPLQEQLLGATGLKAEVAKRIVKEQPDLTQRFTTTVLAMCSLRNPGNVEMAYGVVENVAVLDAFNLLRQFPREHFAAPNKKQTKFIRAALKPIFKGNRFHIARKRNTVKRLIAEFDFAYRDLMNLCQAYAKEYYGGPGRMRASITARAAFENEPITLYPSALYDDFDEAINAYELTRDAEVLRALVDTKVSASLRKVDALLAQGKARRLGDGGFEIEMRTIDGINYSIHAWDDRRQARSLRVSFPVAQVRGYFESSLPGWVRLRRPQIRSLRYRFTTDGWVSSRVAVAHLEQDAQGSDFISFAVNSKLPLAGRLEGVYYLGQNPEPGNGDRVATLSGYAFTIPDKHQLAKLVGGLA